MTSTTSDGAPARCPAGMWVSRRPRANAAPEATARFRVTWILLVLLVGLLAGPPAAGPATAQGGAGERTHSIYLPLVARSQTLSELARPTGAVPDPTAVEVGETWLKYGESVGKMADVGGDYSDGLGDVLALPERNEVWAATGDNIVAWDLKLGSHRVVYQGTPATLLAAADDSLWIGANEGLLRLLPDGSLRRVELKGPSWELPDKTRLWSMAEDAQGNIWAATASGVIEVGRDGTLSRWELRTETYRPIWDVAIDGRGAVWVVSGEGVPGKLVRFDPDGTMSELGLGSSDPVALAVDVDDTIWVALRNERVEHRAGDFRLLETFRPNPDGLVSSRVLRIEIAADGTKWFGTDKGLSRLDADGRWRTYTTEDGLPGPAVRGLDFGDNGDVWIGTTGGLAQLPADQLAQPPAEAKLALWGTESGALPERRTKGLAIDAAGNRWVGMIGGGLARMDEFGQWTVMTRESTGGGLAGNEVRELILHPDGSLWAATESGVSRLDPRSGSWRSYTAADGLAMDAVNTLAADADGRVWVGTDMGYSIIAADGVVSDQAPDALYMWYRDGSVGIDTSRDLESQAVRHHFEVPPRSTPDEIAGMAMTANNRVLTWYSDGARSVGSTAELANVSTSVGPYQLPVGRTWADIVAVAVDKSDTVWAYFGDGTVGGGNAGNLTLVAPAPYVLPTGKRPDDIVEVAFDSNDRVYAWYRDGTMSTGDTFDLGRLRQSRPYAFPPGRQADDVVGAAFLRPGPVNNLIVDHGGNAWMGQQARPRRRDDRLFRLTPDGVVTGYDTENGLARFGMTYYPIGRLAVAPNGDVWVSNYSTAIFSPEGKTIGRVDEVIDELLKETRDYAWGPDGTAWIGTTLYLAHRRADGKWERWPDKWPNQGNMPGGYAVRRITLDRAGDVWTTTDQGLFRFLRRGVGGACGNALAIDGAETTGASIESAEDVDVFRFDVAEPYTWVEITVTDPEHRLEVLRTCEDAGGNSIGASSGSGRHIAPGAFEGFEHRHRYDAGPRAGPQYIAIRAKPGGYEGQAIDYNVRVSLTRDAPVDQARTLILTHRPRLEFLYSDTSDSDWGLWERALQSFIRRPDVRGRLVLNMLDEQRVAPAVIEAFQEWQSASPVDQNARARELVRAIRAWLDELTRTEMPNLRYVVIAGDDNVLPFNRVRIEAPPGASHGWELESRYLEGSRLIGPGSRTRIALNEDNTLGDDAYALGSEVEWGVEGLRIDLPELAVGRLVESPADMITAINAYIARDGTLRLDHTVAAGYDFMQDGPEQGDQYLDRLGAVPESGRRRLIGGDYRLAQWRDALFSQPFDLLFFGAHATHYFHETPGNGQVSARDILTTPGDFGGRLVYGLACHAGLNVPGGSQEHGEPLDFAEAWSRRGVTYVGTTGWAYGFDGALQYQEDLMTEFTRLLVRRGGTTVGGALTEAKRNYYWDMGALNHFHAKTLAGTVLYGLPMYRVVTANVAVDGAAADLAELDESILESLAPDLALSRQTLRVKPGAWVKVSTKDGAYFELGERRARPEAGQPTQPRYRWARYGEGVQAAAGLSLEPRSVVWLGGVYEDHRDFQPWVFGAGKMGELAATTKAEEFKAPGWFPSLPVNLRTLPSQMWTKRQGKEAQVVLTLGQYDSDTKTERLYDRAEVAVYYSASADMEPPVVDAVETWSVGDRHEVAVQAHDASTILGVYITWTDGRGTWQSEYVAEPSGLSWRATVPRETIALVQVVDRAGNVAVADNGGVFYRLAGW